MTKNATTFYAKDSLFFRIFTIFLILTIEPLKILWRLHLLFNSGYYRQIPITVLSTLYAIITIAVVIILFFPISKHWKKYAIIFGSWLVASIIFYALDTILDVFVYCDPVSMIALIKWLLRSFTYTASAVFSFLLLTGKKPFKYIYIVVITLTTLFSLLYNSLSLLRALGLFGLGSINIFHPIEVILSTPLKTLCTPFMWTLCYSSPLLLAILVFAFSLKAQKVKNIPVATIPTENHINELTINTADIPVEEVVSVEQQIPVDISPKKVNIENTPTEYIYCAHCGAKGLTNTTFCTKCGQPHIIID